MTVDRQAIVGVQHHADPSLSTTWSIRWPVALLQLAYLQILATILVGLIGALTWWHARLRGSGWLMQWFMPGRSDAARQRP